MSEIFDFLKKTEVDSRRKFPSAPPTVDLPLSEEETARPAVEQEFDSVPAVSEIVASDKFDLAECSPQLRNALDPATVVGEQFRALRTRLNLLQKQNEIKVILVTSTVPEEGKSFTACGLAGVIAQEPGKRVVVIDLDMRKPGSGRDLGLPRNHSAVGTAQVLKGEAGFRSQLLSSTVPEFWFLPAGALPPNPSELLSTPKLEEMIRSAADMFDWVIIDSPPVLILSDATMIAPLCDTVLLVVRANSTPAKLVLESINRIGRERIGGVVINRQKQMPASHYYYQYYYKKK